MGLVFEGNANLAIALRDSIEGMLVKGVSLVGEVKIFLREPNGAHHSVDADDSPQPAPWKRRDF